jgi:hypothetical protein
MVAWQQAGIAARQERAGHQAQHAHERGLGARLVAGKQRYHHARRCPEDRAHVDIAIAMLEQGRAVAQRIEEIALDVHVDIAVERRVIDEQRGHALSLVSRLEQAIAKVHAFARSMDAADAERGVKARGGKGLALHHQPRFPQVVEHVVEIIDHVLRDRCGRLHIAFGADVAGDEIQPAFLHHPGGAPELVGLDRIDIVVIERDQAVARVVGADVAGVGRAARSVITVVTPSKRGNSAGSKPCQTSTISRSTFSWACNLRMTSARRSSRPERSMVQITIEIATLSPVVACTGARISVVMPIPV